MAPKRARADSHGPPAKRGAGARWGRQLQSGARVQAASGNSDASRCRIEMGDSTLKIYGAPPCVTTALQSLPKVQSTSGGKTGGKVYHLPHKFYRRCRRILQNSSEAFQEPPDWAFVGFGYDLLRMSPDVRLPKKTAQVLLRDVPAEQRPQWWRKPTQLPTGPGWPRSLEELRSRDGEERQLLPYQLEGVKFGLSNGGRVLLGDEMGLGKTVQALVLAAHYFQDWPLLVVCPASLCRQWQEEATTWLPEPAVGPGSDAVQILAKGSDVQRRLARIFVISYDLLAKHPKFQVLPDGGRYRTIICDEAHYLKSPDSQRTRAIAPMVKAARRAILLTGTAAVNNAAELHTAIDCLLPGLVPSWKDFVERYCEPKEVFTPHNRTVIKWEGSRRPDELHLLLRKTVMVRRLKKDVLAQLPAKRRQRVRLDPDKLDKEAMRELAQLLKDNKVSADSDALLDGASSGSNQKGAQLVAECAKLTCRAKEKAVRSYVEYLVQARCRFLLFAHHLFVLDYLEDTLRQLQVQYIRVDGSVPLAKRTHLVEKFQSDPSVQVALLSITACGQGLNLQSASTVVFAELYWVVGQMLQAEDRSHRVGQSTSVNIHYLLAAGTLDDVIHDVLNRKHKDVCATLDGDRKILQVERVAYGKAGSFVAGAAPDASSVGDDPTDGEGATAANGGIDVAVSTGGTAVDGKRDADVSCGSNVVEGNTHAHVNEHGATGEACADPDMRASHSTGHEKLLAGSVVPKAQDASESSGRGTMDNAAASNTRGSNELSDEAGLSHGERRAGVDALRHGVADAD